MQRRIDKEQRLFNAEEEATANPAETRDALNKSETQTVVSFSVAGNGGRSMGKSKSKAVLVAPHPRAENMCNNSH